MRKLYTVFTHCTRSLITKAALHTGAVLLFAAAAATSTAEVKVYAFIGQKKNSYDTTPYISGQEFESAIQAAEKSDAADITVSVNSGGGSVTGGNLIISSMKKCTKPVTAVIDGYAASMGYYMCLGAGKILAAKNSIIMLHSVQGQAVGSPDELIAEAEALKTFNASLATMLAARTGLTEAEVTEKYLGKEVYFTAQEALEAKLIDGIASYDSANVPDVTASMSLTEANERFTAMLTQQNNDGFIARIVAEVKERLGIGKAKEPKAMLSEVEENHLGYLLYNVRNAADEAYCGMENASTPEVKALLDEVYKTNAAFTVRITTAIYGTEMAAADVEAKAKERIAKVATEKQGALTATAIEAARQLAQTQLAQVNQALADATAEVERLTALNNDLVKQPAANPTRVTVKKDGLTKVTALEETPEELLTSYDRERLARLQRERDAA